MTNLSSPSAPTSSFPPRFGKDHLVLADWPLGAATFQQRPGDDGEPRDYAEFIVDRSDGTRQKVTLESPSRIGLPTAVDHDTLIALLLLAKQEEFRSDVVRFVPWQLVQILGWSGNQKSFRRLKASLKRLKAVTATYENAWYNRQKRTVESFLITGILAEANIVFRRGRRAADDVPESYVQWTKHMHASLEEGSVVDLDLDLYFSCKRPGAKHLLRHLNKVWHAGKKPKPYARDLKELACGHLGMTDCKDLKRNFQDLVAELEVSGYLKPEDPSVRYQRIRQGVWRVNLELHPDQTRSKGRSVAAPPQAKAPKAPPAGDSANLVRLYHEHRFKAADYVPETHELSRAKKLLKEHGFETLAGLAATVARTVEQQFRGADLYFGSAVPYFEKAAKLRQKSERIRDRQTIAQVDQATEDAAIIEQKRQRRLRRERQLVVWNRLAIHERTRYLQSAIDGSRSDFDWRRLSQFGVDDDPPREALEEMDRDRASSGAASHLPTDLSPLPVTEPTTEVPAAGGRPGNRSA